MKWQTDLIRDIRTHTFIDDQDSNSSGIVQRTSFHDYPHPEFTECNRNKLLEYFLKIKDNAKSILEIGVCRNDQESSTHVFLNNKNPETIYVGIDLDDKKFLHSVGPNIFTIQGSSSEVPKNMSIIKSLGVEKFDFIFIDGWHSINQVLIDWEYTKWLDPKGIVGFHDIETHPGPFLFIRNLNTNLWNVDLTACSNDYGIGFAWPK